MAVTKQPFVTGQKVRNRDSSPKFDSESLRQKLLTFNREPFVDLLSEWLECAPSQEALLAFAEQYPDRYITALSQLARLGGFTEKRELDITHTLLVKDMSDSQLEDRLANLTHQLELVAVEVQDEGGEPS